MKRFDKRQLAKWNKLTLDEKRKLFAATFPNTAAETDRLMVALVDALWQRNMDGLRDGFTVAELDAAGE